MTEDEAKTKWCPFVRLVIREDGNHNDTWAQTNRGDDVNCEDAPNCIGSACMAWRRSTVLIDRATLEPAILGVAAQGQLEERFSAEGYCGLAGAPQ